MSLFLLYICLLVLHTLIVCLILSLSVRNKPLNCCLEKIMFEDLTPLNDVRSVEPTVSFTRNQNSGHTLNSALLEPIDNSFDSGASQISVYLSTYNGKRVLVVADNGTKALSPSIMHMMASEGWTTKKTSTVASPNLGKNGSGWKNFVSKFSITGHSTVIMKCEDECIHAMEYNQSNMKAMDDWTVTVRKCHARIDAEDQALAIWKEVVDENGNYMTHGTIVVVHNLKDEAYSFLKNGLNFNPSGLKNQTSIGAQLGEVYQKRIENGTVVKVGQSYSTLKVVSPLDPMLCQKPVQSKVFKIGIEEAIVKVFLLPERSDCKRLPKDVYTRPINNQNSGVYFYRDGRLHLDSKCRPMHPAIGNKAIEAYIDGYANGTIGKRKTTISRDSRSWVVFADSHGRASRVRITIEVSSNLDKDFNVNQIKTEIDLTNDSVSEIALWCYEMPKIYDQYRNKNASYTYIDKWRSLTKGYRKDVLRARVQVLSNLRPEELKIAKSVLSKFTETLGEVVE